MTEAPPPPAVTFLASDHREGIRDRYAQYLRRRDASRRMLRPAAGIAGVRLARRASCGPRRVTKRR